MRKIRWVPEIVHGARVVSWVCMSADHVDPDTSVNRLGDYSWWAYHGGVEAMREEVKNASDAFAVIFWSQRAIRAGKDVA